MVYVYIALAVLVVLLLSVTIVRQGTVGVSVLFGKYHRILRPGLNFKIPLLEAVFKRISLQHRSVELEFQAITSDQANVNFKTLILYAVENDQEETIRRAAFKFIDDRSLMQALIRSIEGSIRAFVASRKQNEILSLRRDIVLEVKSHIDEELKEWGFHLINLQVNDISFDEAIMRSMSQVVATNNMKAAAENEAQAQYISKTRVAQAEAESKRLIAQAEKEADLLRGEGNALLRERIALGLAEAEKIMSLNDVNRNAMFFTMWLDSMKYVAAHGHGNIISFDGSNEGFDKTWKQMSLLSNSTELQKVN